MRVGRVRLVRVYVRLNLRHRRRLRRGHRLVDVAGVVHVPQPHLGGCGIAYRPVILEEPRRVRFKQALVKDMFEIVPDTLEPGGKGLCGCGDQAAVRRLVRQRPRPYLGVRNGVPAKLVRYDGVGCKVPELRIYFVVWRPVGDVVPVIVRVVPLPGFPVVGFVL